MNRRSLMLSGVCLACVPELALRVQNASPKRFALVVSNSRYETGLLRHVERDASIIKAELTKLGFTVDYLTNGTRSMLRTKLKDLKRNLEANPDAIAFIYYAGLSVKVDDEQYFVPVDNSLVTSREDVREDCLSLSVVLKILSGSMAKACVIVIDDSHGRLMVKGYGQNEKSPDAVLRNSDPNTLIAFSTGTSVTQRNVHSNADPIYATVLAGYLALPNISIVEAFRRTHLDVKSKSKFTQQPYVDNNIGSYVCLNSNLGGSESSRLQQSKATTICLEFLGLPLGAKTIINGHVFRGSVFTEFIEDDSKLIEFSVECPGYQLYEHSLIVSRGEKVVHPVMLTRESAVLNRSPRFPALREYVDNLRLLPQGTFIMGSNLGGFDERPKHVCTVRPFRLGATPITVAVWREYCQATRLALPEPPSWGHLDDHPVVNVSWNDIMGEDGAGGFCAWASDVVGFRLGLPTEQQFEYASRGGINGQSHPWGNNFDRSKLWCSKREFGDIGSTAPVKRKSNVFCNAFLLTDMVGNVAQWCADQYVPYESNPLVGDAETSGHRCVRSGSWFFDDSYYFRSGSRFKAPPDVVFFTVGFRISTDTK